MRRWIYLLPLLPMAITGPLRAQTTPVDCLASGLVLLLGATSEARGDGFTYWATLSNPGMRPVRVEPRFGDAAAFPPFRLDAGRTQRLRLGDGAANLSAEDLAAATRLRCQRIATQP
jgi:hypothetical protein